MDIITSFFIYKGYKPELEGNTNECNYKPNEREYFVLS